MTKSEIVLVAASFSLIVAQACVADHNGIDAASKEELPVTADDREHWAYRPLLQPRVPAVNDPWVREPIDGFVLQRLRQLKLEPMPPAQRVTLLRRLCFDLTGLPPTADQVTRFLSDTRPNAYQRLIDQLLASPQYGEHWGQYWLDLARFAETDGFEHDAVRPNAWRYRDWVIDSLNDDLRYDRFVQLQLAGDLLEMDAVAQLATGFALCGPDMPDINDQQERRHVVLNELTSTVGSVFLGLQIGCAQCHDHKYDPISQADFYRLRAFFESSVPFKEHELPGEHGSIKGRVLHADKHRDSYLMVAGDFRRQGPSVVAAFPRIANAVSSRQSRHEDEANTRLQLAGWLTQDDHALATRVIVNRVWQYHFGEGLVRTPSDFGAMGDEPRYAELLDWLARELPRLNWSLKRLHRQIVNSATYRQASGPFTASGPFAVAEQRYRRAVAADAENRFLARQHRRRLAAEAIRDSLLFCSGRLCGRAGGPGVMPPLPPEIRKSIRRDHWKVSSDPADHLRRSVYLFVRRNLRYPFLEVFDRPDANGSCARRTTSTVAPQSLALLNSAWSSDSARSLAATLMMTLDTMRARVESLFLKTLGRMPSESESIAAMTFLQAQTKASLAEGPSFDWVHLPSASQPEADALTRLCLAMFNLNEFIYVD